jgi:hypothetical protein
LAPRLSVWYFMRLSATKGGSGYVSGCAAVLLVMLLTVAGLAYGVRLFLAWAERHGAPAGDVVLGAVALVAVYSLYQVFRNRAIR